MKEKERLYDEKNDKNAGCFCVMFHGSIEFDPF